MMLALTVIACESSDNDDDDDRSTRKEESESRKSKKEIELDAPTDLAFSYDMENTTLTVTWGEVEDATDYEVDYGESEYGLSNGGQIFNILNPKEGSTYVVKVRATCDDDGDIVYSDWAELECAVPNCAEAPSAITPTMDGTILELAWSSVTGATSYDVIVGSVEGNVANNNAYIQVEDGKSYSISVRTVREVASGTYHSDWVSIDYAVPKVDVSTYSYMTAFLLDYNHLLEWAKLNGYSYKAEQTEDYILVDVYFTDALNSGFWNTVTRILDSAVGAFVDSYLTNTYDTYTNDFSSVESSLLALFESGGVKEYVADVDDAATTSGMEDAFVYGLEALLLDTNVHCYYYYNNTNRAAFGSWCVLLKNGREDYKEQNVGRFSPKEDGRYYLELTNTGQPFVLEISQMKLNSFDYWSVISTHK